MIKSFRGKLLHVNLTNQEIIIEPLNDDYARDFLGGAGYACRYLYDKLDKNTDPLSLENILMIMTGPLNGTFAPNSGRWTICSKSPYTNMWGESNCGSWFGAEIKKAGYDGIIISGASKEPVYIEIKDDKVEIRDARFLWGRGTEYTTMMLKDIFGDDHGKVACIGQAGENLVKYANVISEQRAAGRIGMGAIFGSKKLKAIIVRGNNLQLDVHNKDKLKKAIKDARDNVKNNYGSLAITNFGTSGTVNLYSSTGELPVKYFTIGKWNNATKISGIAMAQTILVKNRFCHSCVIGCGRRIAIKEGKYKTEETEGPEYETICGFGSLILNDDLEFISYINTKCNDYGIDTVSSSGIIACIIYHYTIGNIKSIDIDGLKPNWGNIETVEQLLNKIVYREGIGDILAEGSNAFGEYFNIPQDEIATIDGLEITYHDMRSNFGMSIAYGIGAAHKGPSHNLCDMYFVLLGYPFEEIDAPTVSLDTYANDLEMAKCCSIIMDYRALYSSLIICSFCNPLPSQIATIIKHATGLKFGLDEIKLYGERILNMKRLFNLKMGITPKMDKIPQILLRPLSEGGSAGKTPNFELLRENFYNFREWDLSTGEISKAKLESLGLDNL
ncbi:MAG: aldehyde ferredoxin oxidoreductase family protein [Promethearchaeota archaeon]